MFNQPTIAPKPLPEFFRPFFWSFDFDVMDTKQYQKTIIVQTINYGQWKHWQWLAEHYGKPEVARILSGIPVTEIRPGALTLARLLFGVKKLSYAQRGSH